MKAMGKLEEIYNKPNVSEIIVDHFDDVYWEEDGKILESDSLFKDEAEILSIVDSLLNSVGRKRENIENGFADLRLKDGTRVAITLPPISLNGATLVIRKLPTQKITVEDIKNWKCVNDEGWQICDKLLKNDANVVLAGNAGSGKTSIVNLLMEAIPEPYRVVTVEKTAEMMTGDRKRTLRLETPDSKSHELKDLLKKAGMLRADYLVIIELVGSETFEAVNLMRAGYSVLATVMAEGVRDALKKLEIFCMMENLNISPQEIKYHVSSGVDAVIFQERLPNGRRVMSNISLIEGLDQKGEAIIKPLFRYDEDGECFVTTKTGKDYLKV